MTGTPPAGTLFLVSTPIGNERDITLRALRILREADVVIYEERREGERLLSRYGIRDKPVGDLNEHNEESASGGVIEVLTSGRSVALISDAGTPVVSDPGFILVRRAIDAGVRVVPVPGPSSIITALTVSGFAVDRFVFCGFLSRKSAVRRSELRALRTENRTMIIMDTPYRLRPLLKDVEEVLGSGRRIAVAFNMTLPDERVHRGTAAEVLVRVREEGVRGEFVLIVEGTRGRRGSAGVVRPEPATG